MAPQLSWACRPTLFSPTATRNIESTIATKHCSITLGSKAQSPKTQPYKTKSQSTVAQSTALLDQVPKHNRPQNSPVRLSPKAQSLRALLYQTRSQSTVAQSKALYQTKLRSQSRVHQSTALLDYRSQGTVAQSTALLDDDFSGTDFYSAHKSEVAGTSLFTGSYPKENRQAAGQIQRVRQPGRQADRRLWWMMFRVETGREVGRRG